MASQPNAKSPSSGERETVHSYAAVHVLLLSWTKDDLGVKDEISDLADAFEDAYGFLVERASIPSKDSDNALGDILKTFVNRYQSPRTLLIVYYAGHGRLNEANLAEWFDTSSSSSATARWYIHQWVLEDSTADVLLVLDCCQPLGGGGRVLHATGKQVLAACGFGRDAPGVGPHSFTRAFIEELMKSAPQPFTVSQLHSRVINNLRGMVPDRYGVRRAAPILTLLGEGGFPSPSIRLVSYATYPINLIALMGMTGSGKSSLINRICGREVAKVGLGQESMTKDVIHYNAVVEGESVTLIDTPGFDDTYLTDRQVLERISSYLFEHWQSHRRLNGLLYLRDINMERMTGSALKNLHMFVRLCGEKSLRNVMLVTTKWDKADLRSAENHEGELTERFWADMIRLGCSNPVRVCEGINEAAKTVEPSQHIVFPMLRYKPLYLQIQRELGKGKDLIDTEAGRYIDQSLSGQIEDLQKARMETKEEYELATVEPVQAALSEQLQQNKEGISQAEQEKEALREEFTKVREAEAERRRELFGLTTLSHLDDYVEELDVQEKGFRSLTLGLASYGLYKACKHLWKKQGKAKDMIGEAKKSLYHIRFENE